MSIEVTVEKEMVDGRSFQSSDNNELNLSFSSGPKHGG